jgi:hypothetical protein
LESWVPAFLPSLPIDPFTGDPFFYRPDADGQGYLLYSVGPNLVDDEGVPPSSSSERLSEGNIVWRL